MKMNMRIPAAVVSIVIAFSAASAPAPPQPAVVQITTLQAMQMLVGRGEFAKVRQIALADLWNNMRRPESLYHATDAMARTGDKEQAGAFCHILLAVLEERAENLSPRETWLKKWAQTQLETLDVEFRRQQAKYRETAAGKKFTSPDKADDLWMTQVRADLHTLHGLYAWTLVGGRKDASPDWIHNRQGVMHRSAMKYVGEVDGRKGVLFGIPLKAADSQDADEHHRAALKRAGHTSRITTTNPGQCRFLRIGTKGYGFPYVLRVRIEDKEVCSQPVGTDAWSDLKIDLGEPPGKDLPVVIELVVPEGQRWSEGAWFDYLDFFED